MPKTWKILPRTEADIISQLLSNRGIKTRSQIERFFNPKIADYEDDLAIPNIGKAKKRIEEAVKNNELIIVYGDYDVDGVSGTAVLYYGLSQIGAKVLPYIPHREKEGYGLSKEGLDHAKDKGAKLIITVDNGIVAKEQADYAKKIGLDLIITDHHTISGQQPFALAIVHSTNMSGSAVAWCLVRKLIPDEDGLKLLDLVAIATIGDLLPLTGVNRALVKLGLEELNKTQKVGLMALIIESGLQLDQIGSYQVGHVLTPRLNAIGRLEHALDALRLLCTKDIEKARRLARVLSETNDKKKLLTAEAIFQAKEMVAQADLAAVGKRKILILNSPEWIPGIIGLIAGRISDEYNLPTIAIARGEFLSKGSARSANGLNIVETLRKCQDFLIDVGGHPNAAGFTIKTDQIDDFISFMEHTMEAIQTDSQIELDIDMEINPSEINMNLIKSLSQLEPTGVGNPQPLFASCDVRVSDIRTVGNGQHLKFKSHGLEAIAFSFGKLANKISEGDRLDLAYQLEINKFNGSEKVQLKIIDMNLHG